jgi:hypothetical protein
MEKSGVKSEMVDFFQLSCLQCYSHSQSVSLAQATASDTDHIWHFCLHYSERSVFHHLQFKSPDVQDRARLDSILRKNALLSDALSRTDAMAHVHLVLTVSPYGAQMASGTIFNVIPQFGRLYACVCRVRTTDNLEPSLLIHP